MRRADHTTPRGVTEVIYSDFNMNFIMHPERQDLIRITNENSVRNSIRSLIMTDKYERPFQPRIGSNIRKVLFEPMGEETINMLRSYISDTIRNHEPRAQLQDVSVKANYNTQSYSVTIVFSVINTQRPISLNMILTRVR